MKTRLMSALMMLLLFTACDKKEPQASSGNEKPVAVNAGTIIASKEIRLEGSSIRLPVGTKVTPSADGYELAVELPKGYVFLTENTVTVGPEQQGKWPLFIYVIASYKCKCSASDGTACQVWYQEDAGGFGCIHKSCSGSCTGSFTTLQSAKITGVLNSANEEVSARRDKSFQPASLVTNGFEAFFSNPAIQQKIAEQYELLYQKMPKPDFVGLAANKTVNGDYVYMKASLYGVAFYMVAPKAITKQTDLVETFNLESASCACDNSKGACKKKSRGFLGWDVYWCEGDCNACVLTVAQTHYSD